MKIVIYVYIEREIYTYIKGIYRNCSPFKAYEILYVILARLNENDLGSKSKKAYY